MPNESTVGRKKYNRVVINGDRLRAEFLPSMDMGAPRIYLDENELGQEIHDNAMAPAGDCRDDAEERAGLRAINAMYRGKKKRKAAAA